MDFIQRSFELNWPMLLFESIFLIGGILPILAGYKSRGENKLSSIVSISGGIIIILITLYIMFSTFVFRLNS